MTVPAIAPTRYRYVILGLLCLLAMITYMDRAANGSAKTAIINDLNSHLPADQQYSKYHFFIVLAAFQLAYALFEVPSGWLGDTRGPRSTLLRVVLWWSLFVALTGFTALTNLPAGIYVGFWGLVVIQFLFGVGEAGAFPNIAKALYNWFPSADRGFAKSAIWMTARLMGGLTPLVWTLLTAQEFAGLSWNVAVWAFAAVAALWCVIFARVFTNKPAEHPKVNAAELAEIDAGRYVSTAAVVVPWGKLLRSRNLWALCGMYVVTNFCWYFLMYNLPDEMKAEFKEWNQTGSGKLLLALLGGAPLIVGMLGCYLGGVLSDRYIRRTGDRKWGRRLYGMIGYGMAGVCYLLAAGTKWYDPTNLWVYAGFLILMGFFNDLIMAPSWAAAQDIGGRYAATVSGAMNMVGNLLGAVTGIAFTNLVMLYDKEEYGRIFQGNAMFLCFITYAIVYFIGAGLWLLIDATKPIVPEDQLGKAANG
jgi:MFS transporter, ACS family, glucarate transporter